MVSSLLVTLRWYLSVGGGMERYPYIAQVRLQCSRNGPLKFRVFRVNNNHPVDTTCSSRVALSVAFLSHIISGEGICVETQKIEAVQNWPRPTSPTDKRSFLGLSGYYRRIMEEAHSLRYSIYPGSKKMYSHLRKVYWWISMKRCIVEFVAKCPNCQQVKVEHQRTCDMAQNIDLPKWKWEMIDMDFITGVP
ncbi:hypothetical protein MTR67_018471 [Solanum verrucosum]|uniref:Integrase zinc-binding domain-containing protein n=1 Tax=Solanum verrucosum TaxID=315347 RepID=A0AAF0TMF1_SOLVR|nr:hypothetical protein MTR67_018471 [Solanum verrucosum]